MNKASFPETLNISLERVHEIDDYVKGLIKKDKRKSDNIQIIKKEFTKENEFIYSIYSYSFEIGYLACWEQIHDYVFRTNNEG